MSTGKTSAVPQGRVMAVDALRGFDMFWIVGGGEVVRRAIQVFVNPIPRPIETQFEHVEWEGFVAWDLIMPLFLFIVGTSLPLSLSKRLARGDSRSSLYRHAIQRVAILWVLGMIAQGHLLSLDWTRLHFYSNTLEAIASGYLVATFVLLHVNILGQAAVAVGLLVAYWLLLILVPVPGHGAGHLTAQGNLAMYIDQAILGRFRDGTPYTWILSSITFSATVLLGAMSGHLLQSNKTPKTKALGLLGAGLAGLLLGKVTGIWFPIIKHIWTSSFVLYAAGWSFLLLALFYWVIDVLMFRAWAFVFVVIGMNAIFAYMVGEVVDPSRLGHMLWGDAADAMPPAIAFSTAMIVFAGFWLVLYAMYRKKIFIKI
jgi:predicted acyltransferase